MSEILTFNGDLLSSNGEVLTFEVSPILPPGTLVIKYSTGVTPTFSKGTGTLLNPEENIWEFYCPDSNWEWINISQANILQVLDANTSNITSAFRLFGNASRMTDICWFDSSNFSASSFISLFDGCTSITELPDIDFSNATSLQTTFRSCSNLLYAPEIDSRNVTDMQLMFQFCTSLKEVPLLDTSSVITMNQSFQGCTNVESGALALYQQASTQANPPGYHSSTFTDCGRNTITGSAELAQIPTSWGGDLV